MTINCLNVHKCYPLPRTVLADSPYVHVPIKPGLVQEVKKLKSC